MCEQHASGGRSVDRSRDSGRTAAGRQGSDDLQPEIAREGLMCANHYHTSHKPETTGQLTTRKGDEGEVSSTHFLPTNHHHRPPVQSSSTTRPMSLGASSPSSRALPPLPMELKRAILRYCDAGTLAVTSRVSLAFLEISSPLLYTDIQVAWDRLPALFSHRVSISLAKTKFATDWAGELQNWVLTCFGLVACLRTRPNSPGSDLGSR